MPRKTKKQKIRSQKRQQTGTIQREEITPSTSTTPSTFSYQFTNSDFNKVIKEEPKAPNTTKAFPTHYILKDLKKTFILTSLAIVLELVLYWFLR